MENGKRKGQKVRKRKGENEKKRKRRRYSEKEVIKQKNQKMSNVQHMKTFVYVSIFSQKFAIPGSQK